MADTVIGNAVITISADSSKFSSDVGKQTEKAGADSGKRFGSKFGSSVGSGAKKIGIAFGGLVVAGVASATAAIGAIIATGFKESVEMQNVNAQFAAGIKSTGNAAHLTVAAMDELAASIAGLTGQSVISIANTEKLLQTFTGIKKIFDEATLAAANMAAKMGGDASNYAIKLGRALQDPAKGMTALSRSGVAFSDSQKKAIKAMQDSGNLMGAQKIILKELDTEFGGAGKAAGETFTGGIKRLHVAFGELSKGVVEGVMPVITPAINGIADALVAAGPKVAKFAEKAKGAFNSVVAGVQSFVRAFTGGSVGATDPFSRLGYAAKTAKTIIVDTIIPAITGAVSSFIAGFTGKGVGEDFFTRFGRIARTVYNDIVNVIIPNIKTAVGNFISGVTGKGQSLLQTWGGRQGSGRHHYRYRHPDRKDAR